MIALLPLYYALWRVYPGISQENQLLEWAQVTVLLLVFTAYSAAAFRLPRSGPDFTVAASLAILMLAFGLRELDISQFGNSDIVVAIERYLQFVKIILGLALLGFLLMRSRQLFGSLRYLLSKDAVILTLLGGVFLLASTPFDDKAFGITDALSQLIEEALELQGSLCFFLAALSELRHRPRLSRPAQPHA